MLRVLGGMTISALLFVATLYITHSTYAFILLPVLLSLFIGGALRFVPIIPGLLSFGGRRYIRVLLPNSSSLYLLLTFCLTLLFYTVITLDVLLTHPDPHMDHIILVTTALSWAVILEPARRFLQARIEQRFNVRNREVLKAIEAFSSTLREEINLDQVCERFLTLLERTLHPYTMSLWVRAMPTLPAAKKGTVADDDPLLPALVQHPGASDLSAFHSDSPFARSLQQQEADLLLPLVSQGELIGLLVLGLRLDGEEYTRADRALLDTLAIQVAPALRVALLVQEEQQQVRERERIEQELRTARQIQQTFLPKEVPTLPGWHLVSYYQPAREVGGDFYDFQGFGDDRLEIVIGDVTGKGIPAALVMTAARTMLRTAARESNSPGEVLSRVNELLVEDIPSGMFVTCFYAILEPASGRLRYANAGHDWPYRRTPQGIVPLEATGMPLGLMAGSRYEECEGVLEPGESLLFFSDGLVEAHNPTREMFGLPRLRSILTMHDDGSTLIDVLLTHLAHFTGEGWEQEDDVTLIALHRAATSREKRGIFSPRHPV